MHFLVLMALVASASPFQQVTALSIQLTERDIPAVLSLSVDYHPLSQAKLQNRNSSPTVQADTVLYEAMPLVNATVGTPPQAVKFAIDIQNVFVRILAPNTPSTRYNCSGNDYCPLMGYFDPGKSSTFKSIQPVDSVPVSVNGDDVVTFGGQRADSVPMVLYGDYPGECIAPRSSFPFLLVQQGLINSPSFSLWGDQSLSNQGHLLFGGVNEAMYEGPLQAFPFPGPNNDVSLPITGVVVENNGNSTRHSVADSTVALLSTRDIFTFLPNETVQQIYADLSITPVFEFNNSIGYVDCARLHSENRTVSLEFGNVTISVPWSALFQPVGNNSCEFTIVPYETYKPVGLLGSQVQLGIIFLQYMYLVVDYDNMFAAVAPLNLNPGPDHILEIGNGPRMPDADGRFPATITTYGGAYEPTPTTTTGSLPTTTTESSAWAGTYKPRPMDLILGVSLGQYLQYLI
ncbi:hypothetical protein ACHAQJ_003743 [Trichoderma viride]